jgi:sarcosine oxidase
LNAPVLGWEAIEDGVRVRTAYQIHTAKHLLLSVGSWVGSLVPEFRLPLSVERQVLFWFEPCADSDLFQPDRLPIFICEYDDHRFFYGFPDLGDGVKLGVHHEGQTTQPDLIDREVRADETEIARDLLRRFLPSADGALRYAAVCMYTNTPDEHFILDRHPDYPQVVIASPCSGHGFKFCPVIGEIAAILINGSTPSFDLGLFKLSRFGIRS